jgi:hypothetical protein
MGVYGELIDQKELLGQRGRSGGGDGNGKLRAE